MTEGPPTDRKRVWKTPPEVPLCAEADIADPGARAFVLQIGDAFFHGFVVRKAGEVAGYVDRCPHQGFPLALELDRYLTPDGSLILCGWHGAVFEPLTGECVGGPCAGGRLTPWPVQSCGGVIRTA
ncbi:Rieske (2Fe-2S) protein [Brevundimonas viscosa]|uniref:Ferredoxin subunit of nitrite reductase or a ring-hydroxylating dioxygenase n=1 Tax=Brevundimonas viscosa TaxID=871741 RepID=A0A1I6PCU1_9CAUL|nr:Rieske (2Fe-2S) protein [Brevundimonas viscosa]SFS37983.1 Ferredoxin subunit of nitrite reductase or a ring-hydroxylating dioxygenase [Brevundimonas viscosa]